MGLLLQNMKSRILHNIMQSRPLPHEHNEEGGSP
jgi:hypothetical protein